MTRHDYDNGQIWADTDGSNNLTARYMVEATTGQMLTRTVASGANAGVAAYLTDYQGSVVDIQSFATGSLVNHTDFDGFGNVLTQANAAAADNYGYTGLWTDPITKLAGAAESLV